MAEKENIQRIGPFISNTFSDHRITLITLLAMTVPAVAYSILVNHNFIFKYLLVILIGASIEFLFYLLDRGKFLFPRVGTAVTSGLLMLSIPENTSYWHICAGLFVALILVKLPSSHFRGISWNPMLAGRLFMFLCWGEEMMNWGVGQGSDMVTAATPIGIFREASMVPPEGFYIFGKFNFIFAEMYKVVPSSPGETLPLLTLLIGIFLVIFKIIDWRVPIAFLLTTALCFLILGTPLGFGMLSGSIIFGAIFIATCPTATPIESKGRIIAGILAGIINCAIREFTYYPEGIMFTFLIISLISPSLDRIIFRLRTGRIRRIEKKLSAYHS